MLPQWTVPNNYKLAEIEENITTSIDLPLATLEGITTKIISGKLPLGLRLEDNKIIGTPFEVDRPTTSKFVVRATTEQGISDRTFFILVEGADEPRWITPEGRLPIGPNGVFFILDNSLINFQLLASDPDLPAGDNLEFRLTGGELPPGITLTTDGRLTGIVDPLLALNINVVDGTYDRNPFDVLPYDFSARLEIGSRTPRKLNREYFFRVTVFDNVSSVTRQFQIFVVGDDFAKADNTIMKAADGVFTADFTFLRVPLWLTPSNLGVRRANNYLTIFLDAFDSNTIVGELQYFLNPTNDDGTPSVLPPGLILDSRTGEIAGRVPYQPAVTRDYKFTINAVRFNADLGLFTVFGTSTEDVLANRNTTIKIGKVPRVFFGDLNELQSLVGKKLTIENKDYVVTSVNETDPEFDTITFDRLIEPINLVTPLSINRPLNSSQDFFFVNTITQFDRNFYLRKNLIYSDSENYRIDDIYPYIEWEISANTNEPLYLIENHDSTLIENALEDLFLEFNRDAYITVERNSFNQVINIKLLIPATSQNRNKSYIESLFETADSGPINVSKIDELDRVKLDTLIHGELSNTLNIGAPITLGLVRGSNFSKTFSRTEEEVANKTKTFNIRLLGEVDSIITWVTPSNLETLKANRISTLSVKAETSVRDSLIRYSLISGKLPPGLILSQDGEIIGKVPVFGTLETPGLLRFIDNGSPTTFDFSTTTFDREYEFTVLAKDRFKYSAVERKFKIKINDEDNLNYSTIYFKPFLKLNEKEKFFNLVDDSNILTPQSIYRPNDPNFGIQKNLKCLVYAGIENTNLENYISAIAKNHKKKRFFTGSLKTAIAKNPGSTEIIYEVVYLELVDRNQSNRGINNKIQFNTTNKITIDSENYETNDETKFPIRYRPSTNTIKADNTVITLDQESDNVRYLSNINTMRQQIKNTVVDDRRAVTDRDFLPLWMRTPQTGSSNELGYVLALPIVYTKPGESQKIKENIENSNFNFKDLDFEIDRYIIDNTEDINREQYILFANYQFNI